MAGSAQQRIQLTNILFFLDINNFFRFNCIVFSLNIDSVIE